MLIIVVIIIMSFWYKKYSWTTRSNIVEQTVHVKKGLGGNNGILFISRVGMAPRG